MHPELENYRQLVQRVDTLCAGIEQTLQAHLTCSEGCSSCCKPITLFPVEAAALREALERLSPSESEAIRTLARQQEHAEHCPLLHNDRCSIYPFRPIICRTHGLPIMFTEHDKRRVDYCPRNLQEFTSLPGSAVIDLDRLNELLVAVNALFATQTELPGDPAERVPIARVVRESGATAPATDP